MPWFSFTDASEETFVFRLSDPVKVAEARAILSGAETAAIHVAGTVIKEAAAGNIGWSYHLDPASIFFFEVATEVGDSTMRIIESHLAAVGGAFLPGSVWTGWSSVLTGELATRRGSPDADQLVGTATAELIFAGGGNDTVKTRPGNDHVAAGQRNDLVCGGEGDDKLAGGWGNDTIRGGTGDDVLTGGPGNDRLRGGEGADTLIAGEAIAGKRLVITDFARTEPGERIQLDRSWLLGLADTTGDGKVNAADFIDALVVHDGDLVFHAADAALVLKNLAEESLGSGDFLLV
jgi:Ca2+-binding RTX toxin-like protein